ncbi:MAG: bifunctional hydroxymethylpyrimidine kinase/phosphomethylpyrimidine kinase [Nibricoccus sp.]
MSGRKQAGKPLCVLTIAGSDCGAGAGVQADARTIHALGGYALMAITAVTAQNTRGVKAWRAVPVDLLRAQMEAVLVDFPVAAIKTGLLPGAAAVRAVARAMEKFPRVPLVIDPVIGSTSGTRFLSEAGVRVLKRELLPLAILVTPNWPEAAALSGRTLGSFSDAEAAGRDILQSGCGAVLIKGGHAPGRRCRDILVTMDGVTAFEGSRIATRNTHGTGCVLSAAIAMELAKGRLLETGVKNARRFLRRALEEGRTADWGDGAGAAFIG